MNNDRKRAKRAALAAIEKALLDHYNDGSPLGRAALIASIPATWWSAAGMLGMAARVTHVAKFDQEMLENWSPLP